MGSESIDSPPGLFLSQHFCLRTQIENGIVIIFKNKEKAHVCVCLPFKDAIRILKRGLKNI